MTLTADIYHCTLLHWFMLCSLFVCRSEFQDWRPCMASLLQPIPFPDE